MPVLLAGSPGHGVQGHVGEDVALVEPGVGAVVVGDELGGQVDVLGGEAPFEEVRRLHDMVVHADHDHLVDVHRHFPLCRCGPTSRRRLSAIHRYLLDRIVPNGPYLRETGFSVALRSAVRPSSRSTVSVSAPRSGAAVGDGAATGSGGAARRPVDRERAGPAMPAGDVGHRGVDDPGRRRCRVPPERRRRAGQTAQGIGDRVPAEAGYRVPPVLRSQATRPPATAASSPKATRLDDPGSLP